MILTKNQSITPPFKPEGVNTQSGIRVAQTVTDADYFYLDAFADEGAGETFMAVMPPAKLKKQPIPPRGIPAYMAHLWKLPVLNDVQEHHCFRKLNYLKYLLANSQSKPNACRVCQEMQEDSNALKESIVRTRNFLVESSLRLVVAIAKRHCSPSSEYFDELICVGNAALIRAVDLFDFRRGTRFSTYAFQAVENSIFGTFRREQRYRSYVACAGDRDVESCPGDAGESTRAELEADEAIGQVTKLLGQLDLRDQHIVKARFGINRPEANVAFHVIAKEIQLSTTRTVQLFNRSIAKMRSLLIPSDTC